MSGKDRTKQKKSSQWHNFGMKLGRKTFGSVWRMDTISGKVRENISGTNVGTLLQRKSHFAQRLGLRYSSHNTKITFLL